MSRKVINVIANKGGDIKYFDVSNISFNNESEENSILMLSQLGKVEVSGSMVIMSGPFSVIGLNIPNAKIFAIGILFDLKVSSEVNNNTIITIKDDLISSNFYDLLMSCPELTEEQFYDLTVPTE